MSSPSPLLAPKVEADLMMDDSLDGGPPSVGSVDTPAPATPGPSPATPVSTKKQKTQKSKLVTGYILYSSDVRRTVSQNNPDRSFGEVSRIVGNEWRNLPGSVKLSWEEKAAKMNEATVAQAKSQGQTVETVGSPNASGSQTYSHHPDLVWECLWDNCDYQFEEMQDCIDHAVQEANGHVQAFFSAIPPTEHEFQCQWKGCTRMKKSIAPFPSLHRLARHVKEVHIQKNPGKLVPAADRSKNYVISKRPKVPPPHLQTAAGVLSQQARNSPSPLSQNGSAAAMSKPPEPMFITIPPKPQRLMHSEAYIKYIEGLTVENHNIGNWERTLRISQESALPVDESKLPSGWLQNGAGNHGSILNALWALREFMTKDALNISKVLY